MKTAGREQAPFVIQVATPEGQKEFRVAAVIDASGTWLESTDAMTPLIDPNLHSCGIVRPQGHRELGTPKLAITQ